MRYLTTALLLLGTNALADSPIQPRSSLPSYKQECAACHTAYPPGLLPAESWRRMMSTLPKHYGVDASIDDAALLKEISSWLETNAGTYKRAGELTPSNRITDATWFERKHSKVNAEVWQRVGIKSKSNCIACHGGAERGDFDDDSVRIPGGGGLFNKKSKR